MKTTSQKNTEGTPGQIRTVEQVVSTTATAPQTQATDKRDRRLPIDTAARLKNRCLHTAKVLELLKTSHAGLFNLSEVVGQWVWVQFRETPAPELRQILAQLGFHWNRERQAWQHPCGQFRLRGFQDPHEKYPCYFPADEQAA